MFVPTVLSNNSYFTFFLLYCTGYSSEVHLSLKNVLWPLLKRLGWFFLYFSISFSMYLQYVIPLKQG